MADFLDLSVVEAAFQKADTAGDPAAQTLAGQVFKLRSFRERAGSLDQTGLSVARSKNDEFGDFLRFEALKPVEGETPEDRGRRLGGEITNPEVGTGEGAIRAFGQGSMFGAGDEIVAGATAGIDSLTGRFPDKSTGEIFDARLAQERGKIKQFRKTNPALAIGAEVAGAIPTALALPGFQAARAGKLLPKITPTLGGFGATGPGLLPRILAGGGTGAGQGALFGFNAGEGGVKNRIENAAITGVVGGGVGFAAPVAGAAVRGTSNLLNTGRAAREAGMSKPVFQRLSRTLQADDALQGQGRRQRIVDAGEDALLADAGPGTAALADVVASTPGPGQRIVQQNVTNRAAQVGDRLSDTLDDTLGVPQGLKGLARQIAQKTAPAREKAYELAYSKPIDYSSAAGRQIEATLARIPEGIGLAAIKRANEKMLIDGFPRARQIVAKVENGKITFEELPNVMQLDYIKRGLGDIGAGEVDKFGRLTSRGGDFMGLARSLKEALSKAVPEYGRAVRIGGDKIERDIALRLGNDLLKKRITREEVALGVRGISQEARTALETGLRSSIDDAMANVNQTIHSLGSGASAEARQAVNEAVKVVRDMSGRAAREKVTLALGKAKADRIFADLDRAGNAIGLKGNISINSKTAPRQILAEENKALLEDGVVNQLRSGEPVNATRGIVKALFGRSEDAKQRILGDLNKELAEQLTGNFTPNELLRKLGTFEAAQAGIPRQSEAARRLAEQLIGRNTAIAGPVQR